MRSVSWSLEIGLKLSLWWAVAENILEAFVFGKIMKKYGLAGMERNRACQ